MNHNQQNALITGASGGIGVAVTKALLSRGYRVLGTFYRNESALARIGHQNFRYIKIDFTSNASMVQIREAIKVELHNKVDIFINCAGELKMGKLDLLDSVELTKTNLIFPYLLCVEADDFMASNGTIILISSISSKVATVSMELYSATKAGIESLVRSFAFKMAPKQVKVIGVSPGLVATSMSKEVMDNTPLFRMIVEQTPVGRLATIEDISELICGLADEKFIFITGQTLVFDGGRSLGSYESFLRDKD